MLDMFLTKQQHALTKTGHARIPMEHVLNCTKIQLLGAMLKTIVCRLTLIWSLYSIRLIKIGSEGFGVVLIGLVLTIWQPPTVGSTIMAMIILTQTGKWEIRLISNLTTAPALAP